MWSRPPRVPTSHGSNAGPGIREECLVIAEFDMVE